MSGAPAHSGGQAGNQAGGQAGGQAGSQAVGGVNKAILVGIMLLVLFLGAPLLSLAVLATMSENAAEQQIADCLAQQQSSLAGSLAGSLEGAGGSGALRVAQANIKSGLSPSRAAVDLQAVYATGADLVSLNETNRRPLAQLRRPGYAVYRESSATGQARSTAVAWRTDRWRRLSAGRVRIVAAGPQKWDAGRSATWATLARTTPPLPTRGPTSSVGTATPPRSRPFVDPDRATGAGAGVVSIVSVHQMINPAKYGPQPTRRRDLYRRAMGTVADLVTSLARRGPVFVAGDFNSQYAADDPWGPRRTLAGAATPMAETMSRLGRERTHDGGGSIDYLFYEPTRATPTAQDTRALNSDHRLLYADYLLTETTTQTGQPGQPGQTGQTGRATSTRSQEGSPTSSDATAQQYNLGRVQPQLAALVGLLAPRFDIVTVGGYRESATDPAGHPSGLAADFMVPMTAQGRARGDQLATYARAHAEELGVDYIIWRQRIWSPARAGEDWRPMADRGSATANHYDHVHINVRPDSTLTPTSTTTSTSTSTGTSTGASAAAAEMGSLEASCAELLQASATSGTAAGAGAGGVVGAASVVGRGGVVPPVPANLTGSDRRNWGGSGAHWSSWHTGTDFSLPCGTPVVASHAGRVEIRTDQSWAGRWLVKITQGPQQLSTWYAHMQKVLVAPGTEVAAGQQIGEIGALGNATGCHLHFEVHTRNGAIYGPDNTDPSTWLAHQTTRARTGVSAATAATTSAVSGH